jgi:hypothetical protein
LAENVDLHVMQRASLLQSECRNDQTHPKLLLGTAESDLGCGMMEARFARLTGKGNLDRI